MEFMFLATKASTVRQHSWLVNHFYDNFIEGKETDTCVRIFRLVF